MLVDALWHYQILAEPVRKPKRFGWASSLHWTKNGSPVPEKDMLFVCEASAAPKAASLHPGQLLIVIASADESGPSPR